jgi:hypothetical protein
MSEMLVLICTGVTPDMTDAQIKSEAEVLFPRRMGGNEHSRIYYMGIACRDRLDTQE